MEEKYIVFTRENAKEAEKHLGKIGWFYNNEALVLEETHPLGCTRVLDAIDLESDRPFFIRVNNDFRKNAKIPGNKYFVIGNPKRFIMQGMDE